MALPGLFNGAGEYIKSIRLVFWNKHVCYKKRNSIRKLKNELAWTNCIYFS